MKTKPMPDADAPKPMEAEIREHAYRFYHERGRGDGQAMEDWLKAERHLAAQMKAAAPSVPRKWQWHYRTLVRLRDALLSNRDEHDREARILSGGVGDQADVANEKLEHDTLLAEIAHENTEFTEVEAAIERIHAGTYGICEVTGRPIGEARLRALPWTRLSLEAAAAAAPKPGRSAAAAGG